MCGRRHHHHATGGSATTPVRRIKADDVRASDQEREEIVTELRGHAAEGRLTPDELEERIEAVYAAKTRREVVAVTKDLPRPRRPRGDARADFREHLRSYLSVMALLVVIWALTGAGYFWPIWPIVGWGFAVMLHASAVRRTPARRRAPA